MEPMSRCVQGKQASAWCLASNVVESKVKSIWVCSRKGEKRGLSLGAETGLGPGAALGAVVILFPLALPQHPKVHLVTSSPHHPPPIAAASLHAAVSAKARRSLHPIETTGGTGEAEGNFPSWNMARIQGLISWLLGKQSWDLCSL